MVYADVVVGIRGSSEELTYAVPAKIIPYIRVGSLVTVPVRRRLTKAVVVKIHQRVDSTLKERLREIYAIDKTHPGISPAQLETTRNLAKKYLANVSDVIFRLLGSLRPIEVTKFQEPGKYQIIQGPWAKRVNFYQKEAEKFQETLIIFPTNAHLESFAKSYSGNIELIILDGSAKNNRKVLELKQLAILAGTVGDSFFPLRKPGLIIVDQPNHIGSRYSNRPYLSAFDIALERSKNEGQSIITGQTIIDFSQLQMSKSDNVPIKTLGHSEPEVVVSSRLGSKDLLLESAREQIAVSLEKKEKILVFVVSKGWSSATFCRNCQELFSCKQCGRSIGADQNQLVCRYCGFTAKKPNYCLNCKQAELVELGEGIDKYVEYLKNLFPQASLQVVAGKTKEIKNTDITIATEKILSFPDWRTDLLLVASADQSLTGSVIDDSWRLLSNLLELSSQSKRVYVQSYLPENSVWSALNPQNLRNYFVAELNQRKQYRLPPFAYSLDLVGQYPSRIKLEEQTKNLETVINKKLPTIEYLVEINQLRDGFQAEIEMTIPKSVYLLANNVLSEVIPPNWTAIPS